MKKFIYAGILIFTISLASYLFISHFNDKQIAEETKAMDEEISSIFKEKKTPDAIYLNMDALLNKYPKADVKLRDLTKEYRDYFENSYDFQQKYETSLNNVVGMTISSISTFIKGENSPFSEMHTELKILEKKNDELLFHSKEVASYLCDKYSIDCKEEIESKSDEQTHSP